MAIAGPVANSLLQTAVERLGALLVIEQKLPRDAHEAVQDMRDELANVESFLKEADIGENKGSIKSWLGQLREITLDMEDILEKYATHLSQPQGSGCLGFLYNTTRNIIRLHVKRQMATEIQEIKSRLLSILERKDVYAVSSAARDQLHDRHMASLFVEEDELVGIGKPRADLIKRLLDGESQLKVISVVGMGGLGKTTLVRSVYEHKAVRGSFECHAWITVTQSFTPDELLKSIIYQLFDERLMQSLGKIDTLGAIKLTETLRKFLKNKRYIVVLDDLWHVRAWEDLKYALPYNDCGSRILITTQNKKLGLSCLSTGGLIYELTELNSSHSWSLFCKKAFQKSGGVCPPELENISQDYVAACAGVPLAIVAIAGLLSVKDVAKWKPLYHNLLSELHIDPTLEIMKTRILLLGYNDLPRLLKPCLLYFSIFPKNHPIKRITLVRLWMAEGFIKPDKGESMEKVAEDYLHDLIDRSLVQVAESYGYGRVRSCRLNNLMYDIILSIAKEENFSTSLTEQDAETRINPRRLSIHTTGQNDLHNVDLSHVRAFFVFGANATFIPSILDLFHVFKLLKVLDLEDAPIQIFPIDFGKLLHLRYLSFRNTKLRKLSRSLGKLKYLQTLDLKGTYVSQLPDTIFKLENLRHLLAYYYYSETQPPYYYADGIKLPRGIGKLRELRKLSYLQANHNSITLTELGNLSQLERLGILKLKTVDGLNLCASIEKLIKLRSLSVTSLTKDELLDLHPLESPPLDLQRLYLRGPLQTLPSWMKYLSKLVRMRLWWSRLEQDSLEILQDLPSLIELALINAYDDTYLSFENGGFRKLEILNLEGLGNLNYVNVGMAMPCLKKMYIKSCTQLKTIPSRIEGLKNLTELHIVDMPEEFVGRLRKDEGADHQYIYHIPIVRSYDGERSFYKEIGV